MENKNNGSEGSPKGYELKFIDPEKVINQLDFKAGMNIADFGSGTGYFAFSLAKKVGDQGIVYALDILKEKLETIESQAKLLGITNIVTKRVNLEKEGGSTLGDDSVEWVVMVNMLFQNKDKNLVMAEAKRVLKTQGKILVIEWNDYSASIGPEKNLRISEEEMENIANENGLGILKKMEISDFHYGIVLVKYK
jgi:ubiquinone/menaquinone biosynthesis C-methylase UbiE